MYGVLSSLALLQLYVIVIVSLSLNALFFFFLLVVSETANATDKANCVYYHCDSYGLHLRVLFIMEITSDPVVIRFDELNQDGEEEK